jgi:Na+/H+-dicarboxylate symporter
MDMGRTSVNVLGNCLASAVVARSEKELFVTENTEIEDTEIGLLGD